MKRLFKWEHKPYGVYPVMATGWFLGYSFYFRERYKFVEIEFYKKGEDFNRTKGSIVILIETPNKNKNYKMLIYRGCLKFLFTSKRELN